MQISNKPKLIDYIEFYTRFYRNKNKGLEGWL